MGSLVRAILGALTVLAAASAFVAPAVADEDDAYYPAAVNPAGKNAPIWERPKFTHFSVMRCSAGALMIDQLVLNRDDARQSKGLATYTDSAKEKGYQSGAGGWALSGDQLKVSGAGFDLVGRWTGAFLTATITRASGGEPVRCRFQVAALRSFTQYQ
jgi:hypothetical protein